MPPKKSTKRKAGSAVPDASLAYVRPRLFSLRLRLTVLRQPSVKPADGEPLTRWDLQWDALQLIFGGELHATNLANRSEVLCFGLDCLRLHLMIRHYLPIYTAELSESQQPSLSYRSLMDLRRALPRLPRQLVESHSEPERQARRIRYLRPELCKAGFLGQCRTHQYHSRFLPGNEDGLADVSSSARDDDPLVYRRLFARRSSYEVPVERLRDPARSEWLRQHACRGQCTYTAQRAPARLSAQKSTKLKLLPDRVWLEADHLRRAADIYAVY